MVYVHQELGEDIRSISGAYTPIKELRLDINGRDVLSVIGMAVVDTACCGSGTFLYATVPGYVVSWKDGSDEAQASVSQVESITDDSTRREVSRILRETEGIHNVDFW